MKKLLLIVTTLIALNATGQKYTTEKSIVVFFSKASIEDITAKNIKASSIFNVESGDIAFSIPITEFQFDKSLMQEHFNEKYMESEKFPKSTFQGKVAGYQQGVTGAQAATAVGKLTIHGITRDGELSGSVDISKEHILLNSKFMVKLEDYGVARPQLLWQNIAEAVEVSIDFAYKPYEKK